MRMINVNSKQYSAMFFNANAYKKIFYELLKSPNSLGTECNIISAIMVNGLLAAELYLKYIISFDQISKINANGNNQTVARFNATHNLYSLLKELDFDRQKQIKQETIKLGCTEKKVEQLLCTLKTSRRSSSN